MSFRQLGIVSCAGVALFGLGCGTAQIECERAAVSAIPVNIELTTVQDGARLLTAIAACRATAVPASVASVANAPTVAKDAGSRL